MPANDFRRFGATCALLAGVGSFLYAVAFVVIAPGNPELGPQLYSALLMANGLLATAALVALYQVVRGVNEGMALWGLLLGVAGQVGAAAHGAYDLSTVLGPGASATAASDAANVADPRGFLTFLVSGIAIIVLAQVVRNGRVLPANLGLFGVVTGIVLVWIYFARLLVLDAANPMLLVPVLLGGFVLVPGWYLWLGKELSNTPS